MGGAGGDFITGDSGVIATFVSFESISYARVSCLSSWRASADTNSCLRRRGMHGIRSAQPVTMLQRPKRKRTHSPLSWFVLVWGFCEELEARGDAYRQQQKDRTDR